jgi:Transposase domain (DUF772)
MMGRQEAPEQLFYDFCLEGHVLDDHLLRRLDQVLAFDRIRFALASHYSHTGRPSADPELMLRMLLIGYAYGTSARTTPACPPRSVFPIHSRHSSSLCNCELTQSSVAGWVRGVAAGQQTDRFDRRRKRLRLTAGQSDRRARFDRSRRGSASRHVGRGDPTTRLRFG